MLESKFQAQLIKKLKEMFPGCEVLKNDSGYIQGIQDLTILYGRRWATLEVKADEASPAQPNQEYYVNRHRAMSYSAFIYPENEEEVLHELQLALEPRRSSRVSQRV